MKGAIRFFAGLLITAGGVGTVETSITNPELAIGFIVACVGLALMGSGTKALVGQLN